MAVGRPVVGAVIRPLPPPAGLSFRFEPLPGFRGDSHWTYLNLVATDQTTGVEVGYLRVAFVTPEMGEAMNRERLLLLKTQGHSVYPTLGLDQSPFSPDLRNSWTQAPREAARSILETVLRQPWQVWNDAMGRLSEPEMVALVEAHRPALNAATQDRLDRLFAFAVNKADVDYVWVVEGWQRRGVATALYQAMAEFLDEHHGMTLNASTTQTDAAAACWRKMEEAGQVQRAADGRRFFTAGIRAETLAGRDVAPSPQPMPPTPRRRARSPR